MKTLEKIQKPTIYTSPWIVMVIDIVIVLQTFFLAYLIRFNFTLNFGSHHFVAQLPVVTLFAFISFYIIGSYKGIIRHTGLKDAFYIFQAASILAISLIIIVLVNRQLGINPKFTIPVSIVVIHYLLNIIVLIASRFVFKRIYAALMYGKNQTKNVLIYGAGESGIMTYEAIRNDKKSEYNIIGYIDDDKAKQGRMFNRFPIFSPEDITTPFIEKYKLKEVIVSIQKLETFRLMEISESIVRKNLKVKIVPPVDQWINGDLSIKQIKEFNIEDLLDRSPIKVDNPILAKEFHEKTILITGAAGSIGSQIAAQVSNYDYKKLLILDQAESDLYDLQQDLKSKNISNFEAIIGDIRNKDRMELVFENHKIDFVFHAAAYKHVPLMEKNPYEAIRVNVMGTKNIMDLSHQFHVEKFVMVSTDKAVNPTNVMGATKRIAEMYAKCLQEQSTTKFITTRFGNVLGSNGSVIPLFEKQIKQGGPLTVTHKDITRFFMTIPEACQLVLEAGAMGDGGEIFVFDMGESVKIFDVAKKMIRLSGFKYPEEIDIKIVGLRPGEKLYEELLSDKENVKPTYHEKIMIAKINPIDSNAIYLKIVELAKCKNKTNSEIVSKMKEIVPEYISQNSEFEKLDTQFISTNN